MTEETRALDRSVEDPALPTGGTAWTPAGSARLSGSQPVSTPTPARVWGLLSWPEGTFPGWDWNGCLLVCQGLA